MRLLVGGILVLLAAWCGAWFFGAERARQAALDWLADANANGVVARAGSVEVAGFPNRYDLTFDTLLLSTGPDGFGWEGPFFQLLRLRYRPGHLIAVFPPSQRITLPGGIQAELQMGEAKASLVAGADYTDGIERMVFVGASPVLSGGDWELRAEELRIAVERSSIDGTSFRLGIAANSLGMPGDPAPGRFDVDLTYGGPAESFAALFSPQRAEPVDMTISRIDLLLGAIDLRADGELRIASGGTVDGELSVSVRDWGPVAALLANIGLISDVPTRLVTQLGAVSTDAPNGRQALTLTFRDTAVFAGGERLLTLP